MKASELVAAMEAEIEKRGYDPEVEVQAIIRCPWGESVEDTLSVEEVMRVCGTIRILAK